MDKLLVVGASGLLGNRLMELYARHYDVHGICIEPELASDSMSILDVTDRAATQELIGRLKPDVVVDAHGITSIDYCETHKEQALKVNVDGTRNVAEVSKELGCKLVVISSNGVFDGTKNTPYVETDRPNPINYYGTTKLEQEKVAESSGADYLITRTSQLFGKGGVRKVPQFGDFVIDQLKSNKSIEVFDDQYGNPTFTDNLAEFIRSLVEKGAGGIFNTAGKDTISKFELARKIADTFGLDKSLIAPVKTKDLPGLAKRPLMIGLDISKVEHTVPVRGMRIGDALNAYKALIS